MEETKQDIEVVVGEEVDLSNLPPGHWKKGMKSPNPNGRPKKELSLTAMSKDLMKAKAEGDKTKMQTLLDDLYEIGRGKVQGAKVGDRVKAIQELFDRGFGKSKTILELNTDTEFEVDWGTDDKNQIDWNSAVQLEEGDNEQDTNQTQSEETSS